MRTFKVTLVDDSQAQDHEDSHFTVTVKALTPQDAWDMALIDEKPNVYVTQVEELVTTNAIS